MKLSRFSVWFFCGSCVLGVAGPLLADGVVRDGIGAISTGRGGTNIAHFDNGAVLLSNPAGIMNIQGQQLFGISVDTVICDVQYEDPENSVSNKIRPMPLPDVTYIFNNCDDTWAAGIGVYAPAGFGATYDITNPILGKNAYKSLGAEAKILPAFAFRATERLSIGATLGVAIGHVELESPFFIQTGTFAGAPTIFDLQATGATPTWSVGLQYQISDRTNFGLVYSSEDRFNLDGKVVADIYGFGPTPVTSRFDADVDIVWPQSVGAGITHQLTDRQRISFDAVYYDWSHAFDRVDMKLTNPSNPLIGFVAGPRLRDSIPLEWDDSASFRFGYEFFRTPCDVIRCGYTYNTRQISGPTLMPLIPATLEHDFSIGYGHKWSNWRMDLAYQYSFSPDRTVDERPLVGGDFSFSTVDPHAHWICIGFQHEF